MTLFDEATGAIINGRDGQDVLNANDVNVHATSGELTWEIQPGNTPILNAELKAGRRERHTALFSWIWDGDKVARHQVRLEV